MSSHLNPIKASLAIIGAGPMAVEYAKVLKAYDLPFQVHGRGEASAKAFEAKTAVLPLTGDLAKQLAQTPPKQAVVCVGVQDLAATTQLLCELGCASILVEKPAAIDGDECRTLLNTVNGLGGTDILIAYNRRYYSGVRKAIEIIEEDGGATSAQFRFTELAWKLKDIEKDPRVKANWLYANSTHVVDMVFHMVGWPKSLHAMKSGGLPWHPAGSRFVGHGETQSNALFSYHADWDAPGGWGVEIFTHKHRLIFQPLETLQIQTIGSFQVETIETEQDHKNEGLKMGLPEMILDFVDGKAGKILPDLTTQVAHFEIYEAILNGTRYP